MDQATWMFRLLFRFKLLILACLCASALSDLQDRNQNRFSLFPLENFQLLPRRQQLLVSVRWDCFPFVKALCDETWHLTQHYTGHVSIQARRFFSLSLMSLRTLLSSMTELSPPQCVYSSIKHDPLDPHLMNKEREQSVCVAEEVR